MQFIDLNIQDKVATLTLNRPDKFNSFVRDMALEMQELLEALSSNDEVRCIVITGRSKAFCAGQDLIEATDPEGPSLTKIISEHYNPIIRLIRAIPKPVVAAVNGVAAGAGANIALACDIVVAKSSASFIQAFSKIGLIPDSGGTFMLPRLIGFQRASALMMLGDKVSADDAQAMGMIYKVFADDNFDVEVHKIATTLSTLPTYGLALTKQALNQSFGNDLEAQLIVEDQLQTKAGHSDDYREGTSAFLAKRKPVFTGK